MKITATVRHGQGRHEATVATNESSQTVAIPPRTGAPGSSVNGGELLFLALATCYTNDIYREAAKRGIEVTWVSVEVEGEFGGPGDPARNVRYHARVEAHASEESILDLITQTDRVAEIQNTLRGGAAVVLDRIEAVSTGDGDQPPQQ